ncbi:DUF6799 domain-containing protein [Adhaeribacter aquaticus]|uniref:DUF6799 domain-containing protein n=1 Tax=Adhaeribacter aquaticus TaxID=299567 RepID=UPI00047C1F8C|nr:DUF6799 domain-containing protein [Adhaeribacter aquaticus]
MKTILSFLAGSLLCFTISTVQAQTEAASLKPESMKDGYAMHNGTMIQIKNKEISPLTNDVTLKNGTKITKTGLVTLPGKKPQKLQEDYAVNLNGNIVMLNYDMMTYESIQQHSQKTLGNTDAEIITTDKGAAIGRNADGSSSAAGLDVDVLFNRRSEIINERNNLVKQRAAVLNRLKDKAAQQKSTEAAQIDEQIKKLSQELKEIDETLKKQ